jgi:acetaldehyde dehydrogenase
MRIGILGSGLIGTDLLMKLGRHPTLDVAVMAGIDPESAGLARAASLGVSTTAGGLSGMLEAEPQLDVVIDATSASAHLETSPILRERGIFCVDLTPAALGPAVVPAVGIGDALDAGEVNLVTCGAQATVPVVAAASSVADVVYAEIVSTIASRSAGPGTRANIDEFTRATASALESVGGAHRGKALIVLNPAEPPITMRNAVHLEVGAGDLDDIERVIAEMVERVRAYVPGYRVENPLVRDGSRVSVVLEVEGAGDFLPTYAGNLDIMTSAAVRVCEVVTARVAA